MKKTAILTMVLSTLIVTFCLSCYASDLNSQISILQQKAGRIKTQISQAQQQSNLSLNQQIRNLSAQVDSLVKQRVQMDAYVSRLENQISDLKKAAKANLDRQVNSYNNELSAVKQQLSGLLAEKTAQTQAQAHPQPQVHTQAPAPQAQTQAQTSQPAAHQDTHAQSAQKSVAPAPAPSK
jgi:chromosome segregation ATPase